MPSSPTQSFPHPLAIINKQDCKPTVANLISYIVVDTMIWEGLGDLFSPFKTRLYPPKEIIEFLKKGPVPIYVGFGSIVVDNQIKLTKIILHSIKQAGQRAIISKGWGNLGVDGLDIPDDILIIGNVPHDWPFQKVSCVIHHGGAGTTAAGLAVGRPTIVVPFFGDQQFWGETIARIGAGPLPLHHKGLTVEKLVDAIRTALESSTKEKAREIGAKMQMESGVNAGVRNFHRQPDLSSMRCAICPSRPAVWHLKHTDIGLSAFAASILVEMGRIRPEKLVLNRPKEYDTYRDPASPLSAGTRILVGVFAKLVTGLGGIPVDVVTDLISGMRSLGHPHDHNDLRETWRWRVDQKLIQKRERESASHGEGPMSQVEKERNEHSELPEEERLQETLTESDDERILNELNQMSGVVLEGTIDRRRSLQLEKRQTMSCGMRPSRKRSFISEVGIHGGWMSKRFLNGIIWIPTDLTLGLSKGFHNAPKMYHDYTVKKPPSFIGLRSGLRGAGKKAFIVVLKGYLRNLTVPSKNKERKAYPRHSRGHWRDFSQAFSWPLGVSWVSPGRNSKNLQNSLGKPQEVELVKSRIMQGREETKGSTADDWAEVVRKWLLLEEELHKNKRYFDDNNNSNSHL
ncbi:hypothetical protein N7510_010473 [Penicillium lagena]|uniref:uncharacterized protein n=1 Tax=Penicillium lagena TaxID=94218 RepID=UPI002540C8BC|nr:uncharacterized protein N7510_010473 [Penicillium lagena]KAJ5605319.1 hypothetical protein N7510_010473 [Penicillium lagena]